MYGELFWEEVELRQLFNISRRLTVEVQEGKGGVQTLRDVVAASRRRLEELQAGAGGYGWKDGLGSPSGATLSEYERRVAEMEATVDGFAGRRDSVAVGQSREELLGLRRRFGASDGYGGGKGPSFEGGIKVDSAAAQAVVERQRKVQDELTNLLLVKVGEMKRGAEVLEGKIKDSNQILDNVDGLVDKNLDQVGKVRTSLRDYVRTSFFHALSMWMFVVLAAVVWVGVIFLMISVRVPATNV